MTPRDLTIVVIASGHPNSLSETVASLAGKAPAAECILVLDRTAPPACERAQRLASHHQRVHLVVPEPGPATTARLRNEALAHVTTPWVLFMASGDKLETESLHRVLDALPDPVTVDAIFAGRESAHSPEIAAGLGESMAPSLLPINLTEPTELLAGVWFFSTSALCRSGGFDPELRLWATDELVARLVPFERMHAVHVSVIHRAAASAAKRSDGGKQPSDQLCAAWRILRRAAPENRPLARRSIRQMARRRTATPSGSVRPMPARIRSWGARWGTSMLLRLMVTIEPLAVLRPRHLVSPITSAIGEPSSQHTVALAEHPLESLLYPLYVLRRTNWPEIARLIRSTASASGHHSMAITRDLLHSVIRYQTMPMDYFTFALAMKTEREQERYMSALLLRQFHVAMNDPSSALVLRNKILFHQRFDRLASGDFFVLVHGSGSELASWIRAQPRARIVAKHPLHGGGSSVFFLDVAESAVGLLIGGMPVEEFHRTALAKGTVLLEGVIEQHPDLAALHASSLNTARITTVVSPDHRVSIEFAALRIGVEGHLDNFSTGGLAAIIDPVTGVVLGPAVRKDPRDTTGYATHPRTGQQIEGLALPDWSAVLDLVTQAALVLPEVRTVGWDVAFTPSGPLLIEGNDNWDKNLHQKLTGPGFGPRARSILAQHRRGSEEP